MIINRRGQYWRLKLIKLYIALGLAWVCKLNDSMNKRIINVGLDQTKELNFLRWDYNSMRTVFYYRVIYYHRDTLSVPSDKPFSLFFFNLIKYTGYYKINDTFNYVISLAQKKFMYTRRQRLLTEIKKTVLTQLSINWNQWRQKKFSLSLFRAISILSHFSNDEGIDGIC